MQKVVIVFVSLRDAEQFTISDKAAKFHAGDKIVPLLEHEFVLYRWKRGDAIVVSVIQVVGDEV